jgi:arginine-tRNA-protein transferase
MTPLESASEEEAVFPCPYMTDGRMARLFVRPAETDSPSGTVEAFGRLLAQGYRRSGGVFYRNACAGCAACIPIRIDVASFNPSRSQRRTIRKNEDVRVVARAYARPEPAVNTEKLNLYSRYTVKKHGNLDAEPIIELGNLHYGYPAIRELHFYLKDRLVGVSVLDETSEALSANYFYYDPDLVKRRLGIFSLIEEIRFAAESGKRWHYLGFLIREIPKMAYKEQFAPCQILQNGVWKELTQIPDG